MRAIVIGLKSARSSEEGRPRAPVASTGASRSTNGLRPKTSAWVHVLKRVMKYLANWIREESSSMRFSGCCDKYLRHSASVISVQYITPACNATIRRINTPSALKLSSFQFYRDFQRYTFRYVFKKCSTCFLFSFLNKSGRSGSDVSSKCRRTKRNRSRWKSDMLNQ